MLRRRLLFAALLVAAGVVAAAFMLIPHERPPRFTIEQFQQLKNGMTREEAVAVLGAPAGDYTAGRGDYRRIEGGHILDGKGAEDSQNCWCGPDGAIDLWFDENGKMADGFYWHAWPLEPRPPTLWERFKRWLPFP
jgi:hypothetical protein